MHGGGSAKDEKLRYRAPFLLMSRLHHQALFARWPRLRMRDRLRKISQTAPFENSLSPLAGWFWFLERRSIDSTSPAFQSLLDSFRGAMDPASTESEQPLPGGISFGEVDDDFSQSVALGIAGVHDLLSPIELLVLGQLAEADVFLSSEKIRNAHREDARALQRGMRSFACRVVRRHLGTQFGTTREAKYLAEYESLLGGDGNLATVRSHFQRLLHENLDRFQVPLTTTFGQPLPPEGQQVTLVIGKQKVKVVPPETRAERPGESLPFLLINQHPVPLTYPLYRSLMRLDAGLNVSSLPRDLVALLDATRAHVAGIAVRSREALEDDAEIVLASAGVRVSVDALNLSTEGA